MLYVEFVGGLSSDCSSCCWLIHHKTAQCDASVVLLIRVTGPELPQSSLRRMVSSRVPCVPLTRDTDAMLARTVHFLPSAAQAAVLRPAAVETSKAIESLGAGIRRHRRPTAEACADARRTTRLPPPRLLLPLPVSVGEEREERRFQSREESPWQWLDPSRASDEHARA